LIFLQFILCNTTSDDICYQSKKIISTVSSFAARGSPRRAGKNNSRNAILKMCKQEITYFAKTYILHILSHTVKP